MPYKSEAQRRFFNSKAGKEKIGEEEVEHWNEVSKGMNLPEKAIDRAIRNCDEDEKTFIARISSTLDFLKMNVKSVYESKKKFNDLFDKIKKHVEEYESKNKNADLSKLKMEIKSIEALKREYGV